MSIPVRALSPRDAAAFQALRLRGLAEAPAAFASSVEEEQPVPIEHVARRLEARDDGAIFGSYVDEQLCGLIGIQRESMRKLSHKAILWGMYVAPEARNAGHGSALVQQALEHAWSRLRVRQVNLGVHSLNDGAVKLYRRHGFEVFGTELGALLVDGQFQDELHMVCRAKAVA